MPLRGGIITDFEFEKCADAVIKVDGAVLGAVSRAECTAENSYSDINEFLSCVPVHRTLQSRYKIALEMTLESTNPFETQHRFGEVALVLKNRTVRYGGCFVESAKTAASSKGFVQVKAQLSAETREVV